MKYEVGYRHAYHYKLEAPKSVISAINVDEAAKKYEGFSRLEDFPKSWVLEINRI